MGSHPRLKTTAHGAKPTSTVRRLNDRYANSYRTSAWRQLNLDDAPKAAIDAESQKRAVKCREG
jgi:hypothetical protein